MTDQAPSAKAPKHAPKGRSGSSMGWIVRAFAWLVGLGAAAVLSGMMVVATGMAVAYPNLPDVTDLADYRPKLPLRVLAADGTQIGEFGEERRNLLRIKEIPEVMVDAVLAIEDARFFEHSGVDYKGIVRAALSNLGQAKRQGASTITMQVARNVYLSAEKTYTRKIYEVLLTFKLEHMLTKEQILEIYMNQIFLGHRAYGFEAAAQTYFGKPLKQVTVAEAAMLAGLPKAPSAYNPFTNPQRARQRQLHIIDRMVANGYISDAQAEEAREEKLKLNRGEKVRKEESHAEYVAELARQAIVAQYGDNAYTRGLVVTTTLDMDEQEAAYQAVREGILEFELRQVYRGPEAFIELPAAGEARQEAVDDALEEHRDNGNFLAAVVVEASPREVVVVRQDGEPLSIKGRGLEPVRSGLKSNANDQKRIRPGALVRIVDRGPKNGWYITQLPEVEAALIALDTRSGDVRAMVGGFDFNKNKFNHVTQAWRQPGSSFKPFIYSAALEKGLSPATIVNDAPLFYTAQETGGKPWEPKNYDGQFDGPMSVRRALAKSKNMTSIRTLQLVGTQSAQRWVTRFGFEAKRHPPYLTMALGAGSATPMEMATSYAVFANGGYRVAPRLIKRVAEQHGRVIYEAPELSLNEQQRAIPARNAFIMNSLLQEVTRSGTAAKARGLLQRPDVYGKTGTTNDARDAWFVGYQPSVVAAAWVGYDIPKKLGRRETGGGLSLPIWVDYMRVALKDKPVESYSAPRGVMQVGGEWYYEEFGPGFGVYGLGLDDPWPGMPEEDLGQDMFYGGELDPFSATSPAGTATPPVPSPQQQQQQRERRSILDIFRN
ncbi:PBP1A family penicillin-binding protein [Hydrogenophaga sp. 5NK40-0174]|uniref:penicillin-binding protein 1A n=1 Tax=Hydrogenophaga sp. 5NK40-0174 TaxID=3127649 RepID=UPI00310B11E6